jgi:hypothetical protein
MEKKSIHIINDMPHIYELEDMLEFCKKYEHLYICGTAEKQEYLLKYFDICGVKIDGYCVSDKSVYCLTHYRKIPIENVDDIITKPSTGIIMGLSDRHYKHFIPKFRKQHFTDYFLPTEFNKYCIAKQLTPRVKSEMTFEISLADHCNISCQMCDHYSQLSEKWFADIDVFERDMIQMGKIFGNEIGAITLIGGEPLLHPDIIKCIEITRREFPTGEIIVLTNGILLPKLENSPNGNIFEVIKKNDIHITVTVYPINFDYAALEKKAAEYGVSVGISSDIHAKQNTKITKISDKHTMDLSGGCGGKYCVACLYFNKFNALKDGRYYMCPVSAHINIFNNAFDKNLPLAESDSLDIYKVKDWTELAQFGSKAVPFCSYCDIKNWRHHGEWQPSTKKISEYIDMEENKNV